MHLLAGADVARREADDLVVPAHRAAGLDLPHCDLVARGDRMRGAHVLPGERRVARDVDAGDDHVVGGIEADHEVGGLEHGVLREEL